MDLLLWDIYEISSTASLQGVMLRGRLRKFANQAKVNLLTENDAIGEEVRFALLAGTDPAPMKKYLQSIISTIAIKRVIEKVPNPVLSKLAVNIDERYQL